MPADGSTAKSPISGVAAIGANATLVLRLKAWSVNPVVSESVWGDSDSNGFTVRKKAREDCTGSMNGVLDTATPIYGIFKQGDILEPLVLWEDNALYWYFGRVLVTSFNLTLDRDTNEVMEWSADFGSDGSFFRPGQAEIPSANFPGI